MLQLLATIKLLWSHGDAASSFPASRVLEQFRTVLFWCHGPHPALSEYALIAKLAEASHSRPRCFNGLSFRAELFATLPLCRRPVCECCVYSTEQPPLPCKCKGFRTHRQSINQQVFVPALIKPGMHGATLGFVMSISAIFRAHGEQL